MDEYNYDALACTVNIEDITSREINRNILRRLKDDDPSYIVSNDDDDGMGWLGYFIGKSIESMIPGYSKGSATTSQSERYVSYLSCLMSEFLSGCIHS